MPAKNGPSRFVILSEAKNLSFFSRAQIEEGFFASLRMTKKAPFSAACWAESLACGSLHSNNSFQNFGGEAGERVVFRAVTDLDRIAAHLAIFDVNLAANGKIQHHRNLFSAIRAMEEMLHWNGPLSNNPNPGCRMRLMRFGAATL